MSHTRINLLTDVEDMAPQFGFDEALESRFARNPLGCEMTGLALEKVKPGRRVPFGHRHQEQEELYVVVRGSGRIAVGDEVLDVGPMDAIRVAPQTWRCFEAGPDGLDVLAFGAPSRDDPAEAEMQPGWWPDAS